MKSRAAFLALTILPALLLFAAVPAFSQVTPPEPDPLARIRAQPPAQVCSEAEPTLCAEAAPKIIANAMGKDSTIEANLRILAGGEGGHAMGAAAPQSVVDDVRAVDWAVAAFRAAGLQVHTEPSSPRAPGLENVVAEIRGREKPGEVVILAAAVGSSLRLQGDPDGVANAAVLVEAARDIAATGLLPRRTIRFVLFYAAGTDECGASDYVSAHVAELDGTIAAIFVAQGMGRGTRYLLNGRQDIEPQVSEALKPLEKLAPAPDSYSESDADANCTLQFLLQGVPTIVAEPQQWNAASSITLDQPDLQELGRHAAIAGVTAFDVAEDVAPLGPRLSRAEAEALMKQAGPR
ncbi:MAG: M28 family peptidase [Candidatus Acidiferrales bacterium]